MRGGPWTAALRRPALATTPPRMRCPSDGLVVIAPAVIFIFTYNSHTMLVQKITSTIVSAPTRAQQTRVNSRTIANASSGGAQTYQVDVRSFFRPIFLFGRVWTCLDVRRRILPDAASALASDIFRYPPTHTTRSLTRSLAGRREPG